MGGFGFLIFPEDFCRNRLRPDKLASWLYAPVQGSNP
jgi:hypothetical protein